MYVCIVVCPKTGQPLPQWFPELQWYVEEETSPRKEKILPKKKKLQWLKLFVRCFTPNTKEIISLFNTDNV